MKGLLVKESCVLKRNFTYFYVLSLVFALVCHSFSDIKLRLLTLFLLYVVVGAIPLGSLNQDKVSGMDISFQAFPFSKRQVIGSKYVLWLLALGLSLVVTVISTVIRYFALEPALGKGEICFMLAGLFITAIAFSLGVPMALRFNHLAGYVTSLGLSGFGCGFLAARADRMASFEAVSPISAAILALTAFLAFGISWKISVSIYNKRGLEA